MRTKKILDLGTGKAGRNQRQMGFHLYGQVFTNYVELQPLLKRNRRDVTRWLKRLAHCAITRQHITGSNQNIKKHSQHESGEERPSETRMMRQNHHQKIV